MKRKKSKVKRGITKNPTLVVLYFEPFPDAFLNKIKTAIKQCKSNSIIPLDNNAAKIIKKKLEAAIAQIELDRPN